MSHDVAADSAAVCACDMPAPLLSGSQDELPSDGSPVDASRLEQWMRHQDVLFKEVGSQLHRLEELLRRPSVSFLEHEQEQLRHPSVSSAGPGEHLRISCSDAPTWKTRTSIGSSVSLEAASQDLAGIRARLGIEQEASPGSAFAMAHSTAENLQGRFTDLFAAKGWMSATKTRTTSGDNPKNWFWGQSKCVNKLLRSKYFELCIALLIVGNAVMQGVEVNNAAMGMGASEQRWIEATEYFLFVGFTVELGLRICGDRLNFFLCAKDLYWNWFDFAIVLFAFFEIIAQLLMSESALRDMSFLRVLRVVRCVKVLRVFRMSRFFRELRLMIFLIVCSFRSLFWVFFMLVMLVFVFAVVLTKGATESPSRDDPDVQDAFGNLFVTMFTLFKATFGGNDWGEYIGPLYRIGPVYTTVFVLYVSLMLLAVLNIVTGVFVENTMNSAHQDTDFVLQDHMESEDSALRSIQELFEEIELDEQGEISQEVFETLLDNKRMKAYFSAIGVHATRARGLFRLLDTDSSGRVSLEEFAMGCLRLRGEARTVDVVTLMYENKRVVKAMKTMLREVQRKLNLQELRLLQATDNVIRAETAFHGNHGEAGRHASKDRVARQPQSGLEQGPSRSSLRTVNVVEGEGELFNGQSHRKTHPRRVEL